MIALSQDTPFKPFTDSEVARITGAERFFIDGWFKRLHLHQGCGAVGLDWMQCFALFVGWRYTEEHATVQRIVSVVEFLANVRIDFLEAEIAAGRTWPVPPDQAKEAGHKEGLFVAAPKVGTLGQVLNLKRLHAEFNDRLARAFPEGTKVRRP